MARFFELYWPSRALYVNIPTMINFCSVRYVLETIENVILPRLRITCQTLTLPRLLPYDVYMAISAKLGLDLSHGFLFRPTTARATILNEQLSFFTMQASL